MWNLSAMSFLLVVLRLNSIFSLVSICYQTLQFFINSPFIEQEEPDIIFDGKLEKKKANLKVKKLVKCDHCECVFYENAHLEEHVNNDHRG